MKIGSWKMEKIKIDVIMYADDMVIFTDTEKNLQLNINIKISYNIT